MIQITRSDSLQKQIKQWRDENRIIVLAPTMGNLHAGHLALIEAAKRHGDRVVVSIFVNPTQFVQGEDYADYPRTLDSDLQQLRQYDVDMVYVPEVTDIYPDNDLDGSQVSVPALDGIFCGATRPGHFTGVATVVTKLFNLVQPHKAIFGEKDYQQLLLIRRLVSDLHIPVQVIDHPTVREADGLAMSSRNHYLDAGDRKIAPVIYKTLCAVRDRVRAGDRDYQALERFACAELEKSGLCVDYFAIVSARDLGAPVGEELVILTAAWLGKARLIDNLRLDG